jgi:hypothetical protein
VARKASFPDEQNERKQNEAVERKGEGKEDRAQRREESKRGEESQVGIE